MNESVARRATSSSTCPLSAIDGVRRCRRRNGHRAFVVEPRRITSTPPASTTSAIGRRFDRRQRRPGGRSWGCCWLRSAEDENFARPPKRRGTGSRGDASRARRRARRRRGRPFAIFCAAASAREEGVRACELATATRPTRSRCDVGRRAAAVRRRILSSSTASVRPRPSFGARAPRNAPRRRRHRPRRSAHSKTKWRSTASYATSCATLLWALTALATIVPLAAAYQFNSATHGGASVAIFLGSFMAMPKIKKLLLRGALTARRDAPRRATRSRRRGRRRRVRRPGGAPRGPRGRGRGSTLLVAADKLLKPSPRWRAAADLRRCGAHAASRVRGCRAPTTASSLPRASSGGPRTTS